MKAHLFASINSLYSFFILTPETVLHIQEQELASFRFQTGRLWRIYGRNGAVALSMLGRVGSKIKVGNE